MAKLMIAEETVEDIPQNWEVFLFDDNDEGGVEFIENKWGFNLREMTDAEIEMNENPPMIPSEAKEWVKGLLEQVSEFTSDPLWWEELPQEDADELREFRKALKAIDPNDAPDIEWPEIPECIDVSQTDDED